MSGSKPKWTKETCHQEALNYQYKKEFKKYSYGAYQAALRNKWNDDICSHMLPLGNEYKRMIYRIIFPNNVCYVGLTSNFNRRIFEHLNIKGVVYSYIIKTKMTPIIEKLTDYINVDDAKFLEEYWKNKSEKDGYSCLNTAKTGGIGTSVLKWTKEKCQKEALKYKNRSEFMINNHSAYNSALKNKWMNEICSHMIMLHKTYTKEECQEEALKYMSRTEFANNNHNMYCFAKKYKWLDDICSHMIMLHKTYTKEECQEEALKYNSRNEFKKKNHKIWQYSYKHDWLDEICSHMKMLKHNWTKEECKNEFLKYKNSTEFFKKNHNAYEVARKHKWLDDFKNN